MDNKNSPPATDDLPSLLIVDDQPANVQVLYQALREDHRVRFATGGEQALALVRAALPDLILLDIVMPGIDGFEVCRRLKADERAADVPVIFVTGHGDNDIEAEGLALGAVDFITKPIHPAVVRARVKTHLTLRRQAQALRELAHVDGLTGVANRRAFDERLAMEWRRALRDQRPLGLVLFDIDDFKAYNDRYGHVVGDACLRRVAMGAAATLSRSSDFLARYGGEEFVLVLPDTDRDGALYVAERVGLAVRGLGIEHLGSSVVGGLTISLGAASVLPTEGEEEALLLRLADEQLYAAKRSGKAQSCAAQALVAPVARG